MYGSVVDEEGGWFVSIFETLVGKGKMGYDFSACVFFAEIG